MDNQENKTSIADVLSGNAPLKGEIGISTTSILVLAGSVLAVIVLGTLFVRYTKK